VKIFIRQGSTSTQIGYISTDNRTDRQRWTAHIDAYFDTQIQSFNLESLQFWVRAGVHHREEVFQRSFTSEMSQTMLHRIEATKTFIHNDYSLDYQLFRYQFIQRGFDTASFDNTEIQRGACYVNPQGEIIATFSVTDVRPINVRFN